MGIRPVPQHVGHTLNATLEQGKHKQEGLHAGAAQDETACGQSENAFLAHFWLVS